MYREVIALLNTSIAKSYEFYKLLKWTQTVRKKSITVFVILTRRSNGLKKLAISLRLSFQLTIFNSILGCQPSIYRGSLSSGKYLKRLMRHVRIYLINGSQDQAHVSLLYYIFLESLMALIKIWSLPFQSLSHQNGKTKVTT